MRVYKNYKIPQKLWVFFESEPGLSTAQLTSAIDAAPVNPYPQYLRNFDAFDMMCNFITTFDLVRFYRDNPPFSVENLLQYNEYAIRNFAVDDTDFKFHQFLLENNLEMPAQLVSHELFSRRGDLIPSLSDHSGIAYLRMKILSLPKDAQQAGLNQLVAATDSFKIARQKEAALSDALSMPAQGIFGGLVENRFLAFKATEPAVAQRFGGDQNSLFWQSAKALARTVPTDELVQSDLPGHVLAAATAARPFRH